MKDDKIIETGAKIIKEDIIEAQKEWSSVPPKKRIAISGIISVIIATAVIAVFCIVVLPSFLSAEKNGTELGQSIGNSVGKATGSLDGITNGIKEGFEEGKEEGLSAKDTEAEISNTIKSIGNLEVMKTNINYIDVFKVGADGKEKYAQMYEKSGTVKFIVDLSRIKIDSTDSTITVTIPKPTFELVIDVDSKILDEWQDPLFNGNTAQGQKAKENADKEVEGKIKEEIQKNTQLSDAAKEASCQQIELLVKAMLNSSKEVIVIGGDK